MDWLRANIRQTALVGFGLCAGLGVTAALGVSGTLDHVEPANRDIFAPTIIALQTAAAVDDVATDALRAGQPLQEQMPESSAPGVADAGPLATESDRAAPAPDDRSQEPVIAAAEAALSVASVVPAAGKIDFVSQDSETLEASTRLPSFGLHLASLSNAGNVGEMTAQLKAQFPEELGSRPFRSVTPVSSSGTSTFVRVISGGFESRDGAKQVCTRIKARGQYCAVVALAD